MKKEIPRSYEHFQEYENFGNFETSLYNNLVRKAIKVTQ
jgi:hypothetical protein